MRWLSIRFLGLRVFSFGGALVSLYTDRALVIRFDLFTLGPRCVRVLLALDGVAFIFGSCVFFISRNVFFFF